ncbi:MAG: TdeIII family type II restriction endonuclease [Candidatus Kapabacteria bacterium]|nr:TdeIII family type II restriction endonuclease [Ignavibacteriota bacterium]MCW5885952.1 TdeIII family type II restriction endonuclease [Candidatus Kapabacteria bacterium]
MPLTNTQTENIETVLKNSLRRRFQTYNPEPAVMPFHTRLLGKDRLALYAFIHSLNTNFGTTIFEPVALVLASTSFAEASSQQIAGVKISTEAHHVIQNIMDGLSIAVRTPNKADEIEAIREVCQSGEMRTVKPTRVDLKLINHENTIYLIDIKTAKPNAGGFKEFKRTLLEWAASTLAINPEAKVETLIAIPYNPYEPQPYNRWTMRGMLDLDKELKVGAEFWDFLGGEGAYTDLLDIFERIGLELRDEIDDYFSRFIR